MYKKILIVCNVSRDSRSALLRSAEIIALFNAETHLLAVVDIPPSLYMTGFLPENVLEERRKRTQEILDDGMKLLKELGINTTGHLTAGAPVEEICRVAAELGVDMIVLRQPQRPTVGARFWKSSIGTALADIAPCSILITRGGIVASEY